MELDDWKWKDMEIRSSGVHYSGFHLEESHTSEIDQPTSIDGSVKQPFVIVTLYLILEELVQHLPEAYVMALFLPICCLTFGQNTICRFGMRRSLGIMTKYGNSSCNMAMVVKLNL
ncbi:hypothetical protein P3L10_001176 [Capsicum annuum]